MKLRMLSVGLVLAFIAGTSGQSDQCLTSGLEFCDTCVNPPLACYECSDGYFVDADMTGCTDCGVANCEECNAVGDCVECNDGFRLASSTSCVDCGTNCANCSSGSCDECNSLHVVSKLDDVNCVYCNANCLDCSVDDLDVVTCAECAPGYYRLDGGCQACPSNCLTCYLDGTVKKCSVCVTNFQPSDDTTSCLPCDTGCTSCVGPAAAGNSNQAKCDACADGYYLQTELCEVCTDANCKVCPSASECTECDDNYFLNGVTCSPCSIETCKVCPDSVLCDECFPGHVQKAADSYTCDECIANCKQCSPALTAQGRCMNNQCEDQYAQADDDTCVACSANCDVCAYNTTTGVTDCITCNSYWTYNMDDNTCESCGEGCPSCLWDAVLGGAECMCPGSPQTTPDHTSGDLYQERGDCGSSVYSCDVGFRYDNTTTTPSCAACSGVTGCGNCDATDCLSCDTSLEYAEILEGSSCKACSDIHSRCTACEWDGTSAYICTACGDLYGVLDDSCSACGSLCKECTFSGTGASATSSCDVCSPYGVLDSDVCRACSQTANCISCSKQGASPGISCTDCATGYLLDTDKSCQACPDNCDTCETSGNNIVCSVAGCTTSYGLLDSGLCDPCPYHCHTCSVPAGGSTLQCDVDSCDNLYGRNDAPCAACSENCATCSTQAGTISPLTSDEGYYVDTSTNTCPACSSNCAICSSGTACSECNSGYALLSGACSADCVTATEVTNCALCETNPSSGNVTCLDCSGSFVLSDDALSCGDPFALGPQCVDYEDRPDQCTACSVLDREVDEDTGFCSLDCFVCGTIDHAAMEVGWGTPEACNMEDPTVYNYTMTCPGICYVSVRVQGNTVVDAMRGCTLNTTLTGSSCVADSNDASTNVCIEVCDGPICNDYKYNSAVMVTLNLSTLLVMLVCAMLRL